MVKFALKNPDDFKILVALKGHSLSSFSKCAGVSKSFVSLICKGERNASARTAKKISNVLEKEITDIFFCDKWLILFTLSERGW